MTATTLTLNTSALAYLLETVSTAAGKDGDLPMLAGVLLYTSREHGKPVLVGCATDRFMLMQGHVDTEAEAGYLPGRVFLNNTQISQVLTVVRPYRARKLNALGQVEIVVDGKECTVRQLALGPLGAIEVRFTLEDIQSPDMAKMLLDNRERETAPVQFAVDGAKLARLTRLQAAKQGGGGMRISCTGPNTPVEVTLGDQFVALLMPIRLGDEQALPVPLYSVPVMDKAVAA
jgi:hypothetical protein